MKDRIVQTIKGINKKIFSFFTATGKKDETLNSVLLLVELGTSLIIFLLYYFNKISFSNDLVGIILSLIFLNFPAIVLLNGAYSIKNFSKKLNGDKNNKSLIILGVISILSSLLIIAMPLLKNDIQFTLLLATTWIATAILIFYFLVVKKLPYFSARQLIFLYFSVVLFIIIFAVIYGILLLICLLIALSFVLGAMGSDTTSSSNKKYRIKRDELQPDKGVLIDKYGNKVKDENNKTMSIEKIDEFTRTGYVNGEKVNIEIKNDSEVKDYD